MEKLDSQVHGGKAMSYRSKARATGPDFRSELEAYLNQRERTKAEKGYIINVDMHPETIEAGVYANGVDKRITARLWGSWMCGASIHAYPERVSIRAQSAFFAEYGEKELRTLLEAVYKRPVHFSAMVLA